MRYNLEITAAPTWIVGICVCTAAFGTGCATVKRENAARTLIESRQEPVKGSAASTFIHRQDPDYLTFLEMKVLSTNPVPEGALEEKLEQFWTTPIISNEAYYEGRRAQVAENSALGPFIRFTTWNIEWSIFMEQAIKAVASTTCYVSMIDTNKAPPGSKQYEEMLRQRERLAGSDVIILQEMDIGMPRSRYINAAEVMASELGMNYTFGVQSLEVDPVLTGYAQVPNTYGDPEPELIEPVPIDADRYMGIFGSAVLSKYPIKHVELFQLKTKPYDWYTGEMERPSLLELSRRKGAQIAVHEEIVRELKVGARNFFRVDLEVPGLPDDTLTVINIHLEIKCPPKQRDRQIKEILSYIKDIRHPVIMAGDFNSASSDVSAVSVPKLATKAVKSPSTWFSFGTKVAMSAGTLFNYARALLNVTKNFYRPLAPDIPVVLSNKSKPMFNRIRKFRFDDGGAFDFRGDRKRSISGRAAHLSNSNHKAFRGQVASFSVIRPIGPIGLQRLDWIFVKSCLDDATNTEDSYRFAPHFGETLVEFNKFLIEPISDHRPSLIDLPLEEPRM